MLTAHLPAGYCLSRLIGTTGRGAVAVTLIFSVLPDFDLIWFYWVDGRSIHHHRYWVHIPAFWLIAGALAAVLFWRTRFRHLVFIALAAILLHLVLDSLVGGILWLAPFDDTLYHLVEVQPGGYHWLLTFVLHWTFLAEIAIWMAAFVLLQREVPISRVLSKGSGEGSGSIRN
jgi:inner membrane protein